MADGAAWGELWRDHQDRYFREHGLEARVDATATHAQEHIGPVRMRRAGSEIVERAETIRQANQEAARDPEKVLAALTRNNATFTERDLDRFLAKQLGGEGQEGKKEVARVRAAVLKSRELVALHDRETGEVAGRFTTREVREQERAAMAAAGGLSRQKSGAVSARSAEAASGIADAAARPGGGVRARDRRGAPEADRGPGGHRQELHAGGGARRARAGRQAGGGLGADERGGAGPGSGRVQAKRAPSMPRCSP